MPRTRRGMVELVALLGGGAPVAVLVARETLGAIEGGRCRTVRLTFPYGTEPAQVTAFCRGLSGLLPPWWRRWLYAPSVVIETTADEAGIEHLLAAPAAHADFVLSQLRAAIPGVRIEPVEPAVQRKLVAAAELRLSSLRFPLRTGEPEATAAGVLATLQPLSGGERLVVQWVLRPAAPPRRPVAVSVLAELGVPGTARVQTNLPLGDAVDREKHAEPTLWAICRIGAASPDPERGRALVRRVEGAFHPVSAPGVSFRRRWSLDRLVARRIAGRRDPGLRWPALLNARELTGVAALPLGELTLPGLALAGARQLAPHPAIARRGRLVGRATFPGAERRVGLSVADSLRHLHLIGPTGVGKSTLMLRLICADLAAGRGVVVIDPKGDLVSQVLDRLPASRVADVILVDPTDADRPVGFNPLAQGGSPELAADQTVAIFRQLYAAFWGPRTDDLLRASLLTLLRVPGMTLAEVPVLLGDASFRRRLTGGLDDYVLEGFWAWYDALSPGERAQAIGPVLNKLRTFLLRRRLRAVIGQSESTFSLPQVLAERKVLLVNLSKGELGEDASSLLGAAILAALWQAVQARASLPVGERRPVFCFVDEFQDYLRLPTSLADVLAQARSYGFGLHLAHQHLGQLPSEVRHAVLANARSKVVFQAAADDARVLAREFAPYLSPTDLQNLGPYEAVFAPSAEGRVVPPATIATVPAPPTTGHATAARALSRRRYGRDAAAVEEALRARTARRVPTAVGTRRRP